MIEPYQPPLPLLAWRYEPSPVYQQRIASSAFRAWHRAWLLGLPIETFSQDGVPVDAKALRRLNWWIQAHGAWRGSSLPWHEAQDLLCDVLSGDLSSSRRRIGDAGAGRWTPRATLLPFVRDQAQDA